LALVTLTLTGAAGLAADRPDAFGRWLGGSRDEVAGLLGPYPADEKTAYPVGTLVNNPKNQGPACCERATS
jgi:putative SOS response-associated peptidase YedK